MRAARRWAGPDPQVPLRVVGVLPETAGRTQAALVSLALLIAAEDYRDGLRGRSSAPPTAPTRPVRRAASPVCGSTRDRSTRSRRSPIGAACTGHRVMTRASEIEPVRKSIACSPFSHSRRRRRHGVIVSLATSLWANVDRKRRELAVLRLVGLSNGTLVVFPVRSRSWWQRGAMLSGALYAAVSWPSTSASRSISAARSSCANSSCAMVSSPQYRPRCWP